MEYYTDPLGFTAQTATILRGLGIPDLIPECKKRNISTQTLHEFTEGDFVRLGVNEKKAAEVRKCLSGKKKQHKHISFTTEERIAQFPEIIKDGAKHLSLLQSLATYCRLRLVKEQIDSFIQPDTPLSASEVLLQGVDATIVELDEIAHHLDDLDVLISQRQRQPKSTNKRTYALFGSIAVLTFLVLRFHSK